MDPSASSTTCDRREKRKKDLPADHDIAKRLKTEQEGPPHSPRISVPFDRRQQPITIRELSELLQYVALGKKGGIKQPGWCRLHHQKRLKGVNVVVVEGLTQTLFYKHYLTMHHLRTNYSTRVTFTPSTNNIASEIFSSEVPQSVDALLTETHKRCSGLEKALRSHPVITRFGAQKRGLTAYVLTQEEMIKRRYPVKGMPGFEEFVCTDSVDSVTDSSPLYGLDCEMCLTEKGNELSRVSLVDGDGNCVLDELVKPPNRILNYLTKYTHTYDCVIKNPKRCMCVFIVWTFRRFSGITAAMLRPVTTTLRDVQGKLRALLPSDAVLVGHSLDNDLVALKLIHQHVIDTSLLYRRDYGQKFKLKVLAETVLKRQIQTEEKKGHNPIEDAVAALELAQYFIRTGPRHVVEHHLEELWGYAVADESTDCAPALATSHRFADVLQSLGQSVAFFGKRADISLDLSNQQWHNSDKELLASFKRQTKRPFLSVLQLSSFSQHLKKFQPHQQLQQYHRACASLRDMCVVFAGPLPTALTEKDVKKLFSSCGPVRKIKMLNTVRVHAKIEFELLEGATLALKTLNGLNVHGQSLRVQRPVCESLLDLELTLNALMDDSLNSAHLYSVKLNPGVAERIKASAKLNGHTLDANRPGVTCVNAANGPAAAGVNGQWLQLKTTSNKLSEETVRETFDQFGEVKRITLSEKAGKYAGHAFINFESSEGKGAALRSSEDLWKQNYLVSPCLTPLHLSSWVELNSGTTEDVCEEDQQRSQMHIIPEDQEVERTLKKLDHHLRKLFTFLPDCTLSLVLLGGNTCAQGDFQGLCFLEVK